MLYKVVFSVALVCGLAAKPAGADRYHEPLILLDGASMTTAIVGGATGNGALIGTGLGIWAFVSPLTHLIYDNDESSLPSFGLRAGTLIVGGLLLLPMDQYDPDTMKWAWASAGTTLALSLAVSIYDAAVLAKKSDDPNGASPIMLGWGGRF